MCLFRFQHPRASHLLPHEPITIVKPILENRDDHKASIPDYQNVETIAPILT